MNPVIEAITNMDKITIFAAKIGVYTDSNFSDNLYSDFSTLKHKNIAQK